jgi:hypothetical protein
MIDINLEGEHNEKKAMEDVAVELLIILEELPIGVVCSHCDLQKFLRS